VPSVEQNARLFTVLVRKNKSLDNLELFKLKTGHDFVKILIRFMSHGQWPIMLLSVCSFNLFPLVVLEIQTWYIHLTKGWPQCNYNSSAYFRKVELKLFRPMYNNYNIVMGHSHIKVISGVHQLNKINYLTAF
jgi:hypothetical protein